MKAIQYILFLFCFTILSPFISRGQDKTIDKIEMLYDQGNYAKVYRKTQKLQKKSKYAKSAPIKLFESLAEYQLSKTKSKFTVAKAIVTFKAYISRDTTREYNLTYAIYIYDLQIGLVNAIRDLEQQGKTTEAKSKFDTYSNLFQHQVSYEEITATKPTVSANSPIEKPKDKPVEEGNNTSKNSLKKQQKGILKEANKHIGTPYKYGGITPKGFDCSGFTQYVMAKNDLQIPRTSRAQSVSHKKIKQKNAQVGDLVFFGSSKSNISHVGIVSKVEGTKLYMIHSSTSKGIMITEITTNVYWSKKIQFITRILEK